MSRRPTRTISEILEDWEQGMNTTHEVYPALLEVAREVPLDDVIREVPEPWRSQFVAWLEATYDNQIPIEDFVWLSSSEIEPPGARRVIAIAREWLARRTPG